MRRMLWAAGMALLSASCTDTRLPLAPTAIAAPAPPLPVPPLPTAVPGVLALSMPLEPGDAADDTFGIAPFGYHEAPHAADGHSGWEIAFRPGAVVRAAAAGTVLEVFRDAGGHFTVHLEHVVGSHFYRTTYSNLQTLAPDVAVDGGVRLGQPLGVPAGTTHFQLDDFEYYREMSNPNAVSPEPFLTPAARSFFDALWSRAHYAAELTEPFATNPRTVPFPLMRSWSRAGGDGPAGIRFTRRSELTASYEYALLADSGTAIETGTVALNAAARPYPTIDLTSPVGRRLGIYEIVSNEMRLSLGNAGTPRPPDLAAASVYRTSR